MNILAYVRNSAEVTKEDAQILTHIHFGFGKLTIDGSIDVADDICNSLSRIRDYNPNIKLILSVVPKEQNAFTVCAADEKLRKQVANSCIEIVTDKNFDGVDFDWEFPCVSFLCSGTTPDDKKNFTLFCNEIRMALNTLDKKKTLSIAAAAELFYAENTELDLLANIVDYICLMTYDLKGWVHALSGHHTQLYSSTGDMLQNSCDQAIKLFINRGVPKEKLLMGAAFYSRKWDDVKDANNGFLQMCKTGAGYGPDFTDLDKDFINKNGYTRHWDDEAKAPWLFNGSTFITYDDEESITHKCSYIKHNQIGGIFYWEHGCDKTKKLLRAIKQAL